MCCLCQASVTTRYRMDYGLVTGTPQQSSKSAVEVDSASQQVLQTLPTHSKAKLGKKEIIRFSRLYIYRRKK